LEKCEHFKKLSLEQQVVKANELYLCLICLRHMADRECYARGKPDYKGCSESGCGMEHHPLLHWALIVALLWWLSPTCIGHQESRAASLPRRTEDM
jgi:hypothetical protein